MRAALLLIDLQADFLSAPALSPPAGRVVERAGALLEACRRRGAPVIHLWTTVDRAIDNRMAHWKAAGVWRCVAGEPGHEPPPGLRPIAGEKVVHKQFFSGFAGEALARELKAAGCDALMLAGVHLHGCVRATAMDAYERGYAVWIADDAVASDDPLHAAITGRYLGRRGARFAPVDRLVAMLDGESEAAGEGRDWRRLIHRSPIEPARTLWEVPIAGAEEVAEAARQAAEAWRTWRGSGMGERAQSLNRWADLLASRAGELADQIVEEVGKPITAARAEVERSVAMLRGVAEWGDRPLQAASGPDARYRYEPLGVIGLITPWNNPLAIAVGKIAPAVLYGNAVVWKPAPAGSMIARRALEMAQAAGLPKHLVRLCLGDRATAHHLARDLRVDGVTLSGSLHAGYALQELCAARHVPFQGELGGNNAAIVWDDAGDLERAAEMIAAGAFAFAGQRCTANRRVIVSERCAGPFIEALQRATAALVWGDPRLEATQVGPLISVCKRDEIRALIARAKADGLEIVTPHRRQRDYQQLLGSGAYHAPTMVFAEDAAHEIVQEESFGPVLVVQRASSFEEAIELCNGVRQGLVAALFSESPTRQDLFLREARAGVLKLNQATADADARSPLGGWKASGIGPAEHGPSDREFYCRVQTIYGG